MVPTRIWLHLACMLVVCCASLPAADLERMQTAISAAHWEDALFIAETLPADDLRGQSCRGLCLAMLGRQEAAVAAFRRADAGGLNVHDQASRWARAETLTALQCYARARQEIEIIQLRFPHGAFTDRAMELAVRIERRLTGISTSNLDWYLQRGFAAYASGDPALAAEYLDEYRLLCQRAGATMSPGNLLALAVACLESGDLALARTHLALVVPETEDWRGALYRGVAALAAGAIPEAQQALTLAKERSGTPGVRDRASRLLDENQENR